MSQNTLQELCVEHCRKEDQSLVISAQRHEGSKLCLGKGLLSMLGNPEWVQFAVKPATGQLLIFPTLKSKHAIEVSTNEDGIMVIDANIFIDRLCELNLWPYCSSYSLKGNFTKVADKLGVLFEMKEAQRLTANAS